MNDIKVMNFRQLEVSAETKKEAFNKIEQEYFTVKGDATKAYNAWLSEQNGEVTERDKKLFLLSFLEKKNCTPGNGYVICLQKANVDTRKRPYKINNVRKEEGRRKTKKVLVWVDNETNAPIIKVFGTKTEASNTIKDLYKSGAYKGDARCEIHYDVVEGSSVIMNAQYTPSVRTQDGTWIAFGFEKI